jgi:predicted cupin superfamily sugar epimerase
MMLTAEQLIARFGLAPLPVEGGYYAQTYRADEQIPARGLPERYTSPRALATAILYLLSAEKNCFSALHRLDSDEVWHFYLGDPVELLLLYPDGRSAVLLLGHDILKGQHVQLVVPRGTWQGARLRAGGRLALLGTTVAPGYTPEDVTFGGREALLAAYPEQSMLIGALTRGGGA